MPASSLILNRRGFMGGLAASAAFFTVPGAFADELVRTPKQMEGPFYPSKLPLDTDNDLLIINEGITPAIGTITHLTGKVTDLKGNPVRNALVEIWQVDGRGVYLHPGSDGAGKRDANFQGFGRFLTSAAGEYYFRTVKPVAYPGRTPHIHVKVKKGGKELLVTQCYIKGDPGNEKDGVLRAIRDAKLRDSIIVDFARLEGSKLGEVAAKFDIVLGMTPEG